MRIKDIRREEGNHLCYVIVEIEAILDMKVLSSMFTLYAKRNAVTVSCRTSNSNIEIEMKEIHNNDYRN
ncbi:MAG: hypothetical protein WAZ77_09200 [Candidatus Nitrosopolaris sp.]